jgi:outer membrane protein assembly factor BamB
LRDQFARITSATVRACAIFFVLAHVSFAADWPQWRGPARTGHVPDSWAIPKTLPADPKVVWRVKAGDSLASPVVADGKVFHVDNQAGKETIHALDVATAAVR